MLVIYLTLTSFCKRWSFPFLFHMLFHSLGPFDSILFHRLLHLPYLRAILKSSLFNSLNKKKIPFHPIFHSSVILLHGLLLFLCHCLPLTSYPFLISILIPLSRSSSLGCGCTTRLPRGSFPQLFKRTKKQDERTKQTKNERQNTKYLLTFLPVWQK